MAAKEVYDAAVRTTATVSVLSQDGQLWVMEFSRATARQALYTVMKWAKDPRLSLSYLDAQVLVMKIRTALIGLKR